MEVSKLISIPIGKFHIVFNQEVVVQWAIMISLTILMIWATRNLKKVPDRKQTAVEYFYTTIKNLVDSNMGEAYESYIPIFGTLAAFLLVMNLLGLIGIKPPTQNYSIALGLALCSFLLIHGNAIKKLGFVHYLLGYGKPFAVMLPINIMERAVFPISLSLRLFGNMMAATVVIDLVYNALGNFAIGAPVPVHLYFDVFDGTLQMVVFLMLTMIQVKVLPEH